MKFTLIINTEDCVGCHACEIACKQEHNLPVGPRLIRVLSDGPRHIDGKPQLRYKVAYCLQCNHAPCQEACPVGAINTRKDGIVIIDEELCNGCKKCIESCPYGVMQFDEVRNVARKCDLCAERLDKDLKPACVLACPSHCIFYGDRKNVVQKLGEEKLRISHEDAN
jgi:Fe-S-cluster-containing dehydrogenase component